MEASEAATRLASVLREERLAVLVGAGASGDSRDQGGRVYRGLPLPHEFVRQLSQHQDTTYISESDDFEDACGEVAKREGRGKLEDLLHRAYNRPAADAAPPAQKILAWLPFKVYVTSNYDQFLERQLTRGHRRPAVIVENEDLPRMKRGAVPVIKYHGCVSKPSSMIAAPNDYERLSERYRLVRELVKVSLAQNPLLVIGHGLGDRDLERLLIEILDDLGDYAPTLFVLREPGRGGSLNIGQRHNSVEEDLTQFLSRLLHEYRLGPGGSASSASFTRERWINSAFFAQLRQASVLPSETQVIDAFLEHLAEELSAREEVQSVFDDARVAVDGALEERQNYTALRKMWSELEEQVADLKEDVAAAEEAVHDLIEFREAKKTVFRQLGRNTIVRGDRVLLYSQSQRVVQTLLGVSPAVQKTCDLFIAECRPKSPAPYEDAAAMCRQLRDTFYSISVCPDVVAINLLASRQITRVIMGTHAIYVDERGAPYAFVNTCGSLAVALAAERYDVPLMIIGESLKVEEVPPQDADDHLFSHQEHELEAAALVELSTERGSVEHLNIGYDLIRLGPNMEVEIPDGVESS